MRYCNYFGVTGAAVFISVTYLVGVTSLEDVTRHLGFGVVLLPPDKVSKVSEIIAVVNESRNELCFVFKYEDR